MKNYGILTHIMDSVSDMDETAQLRIIKAAIHYLTTGEMHKLSDMENTVFKCVKPLLNDEIEQERVMYEKRSNAGKKGMANRWKNHKKITNDNKNNGVILLQNPEAADDSSRACDVEINNKNLDNTQVIIINPKEVKKEILPKGSKEKKEESTLTGASKTPPPPVAPPPSPANNEPVKRTVFRPPAVEEVAAYCAERRNNVDSQAWWDFYQSKGWMVGKNKMKDWKAAVRTWEKRDTDTGRKWKRGSTIMEAVSAVARSIEEDKKNKGKRIDFDKLLNG